MKLIETTATLMAPVAWETPDGGGQMGAPQTASDTTERLIDAETKKLVQQVYDHCYETLSANKELMQVLGLGWSTRRRSTPASSADGVGAHAVGSGFSPALRS